MRDIKLKNIISGGKHGVLNLFSIIYETKNGNTKRWDIVSRNNKEQFLRELNDENLKSDGVLIIATHKPTGLLVILKEFRIAVNKYVYTFPGGMIEDGESVQKCAKRELFEETGLILTNVIKEDKARYTAVGVTNEKIANVYTECEGEIIPFMNGNNEKGEVYLIDKIEAQRILDEEVIGAKTALILEKYILI